MFVSILILFSAILIITGSVTTGKNTYVAKNKEELYGTWINPDYEEKAKPGKLTYDHNDVVRSYNTITSTKERWNWKFVITDKWIDDKGNIWYRWLITEAKFGAIYDTEKQFYSGKISDSGKVLEYSYSTYNYPVEVNPDSLKYNYFIYRRQE